MTSTTLSKFQENIRLIKPINPFTMTATQYRGFRLNPEYNKSTVTFDSNPNMVYSNQDLSVKKTSHKKSRNISMDSIMQNFNARMRVKKVDVSAEVAEIMKEPTIQLRRKKLYQIYQNVDDSWHESIQDLTENNHSSTQYLKPNSIYGLSLKDNNIESKIKQRNRSLSNDKREKHLINSHKRRNQSNPRVIFQNKEGKLKIERHIRKTEKLKPSMINIQKEEKFPKEPERENLRIKKAEEGPIAFLMSLMNQKEKSPNNTIEKVCDLMKKANETKDSDINETNELISSMLQTLEVQDLMMTKIDNDIKDMQDIRK